MRNPIFAILAAAALLGCTSKEHNQNYMWFDCEANYATLSCPDSISTFLDRVHRLGFDNVVVDVKAIMGEVLYDSEIAPYMDNWKGTTRARDYDMMRYFLDYGHKRGMRVFASLNIFAGGHNFFDRGIIYQDHADWQSINYHNGELVPISSIKSKYNGMMNPGNPEVQDYEIAILKEFVNKYPDCDGLIFDRVRYDSITSDFSELSRSQFEERIGRKVDNFPEDILSWYDEDGSLRKKWARGPLFNEWCEYRAAVIHDFVERTHKELKALNPKLIIGDYTGAWYPSYNELGVNWASKDYDPSVDFDWATPNYHNTGYAELLDVYMTGLYYSYITKADIDNAKGIKGENSEDGLHLDLTYCYSVEGGAELAKKVTRGVVPVVGSIYVEQYLKEMDKFGPAVKQSIKSTGGVMIFDFVHLGMHDLWDELEDAMKQQ